MLEKILVPLDGSDLSGRILDPVLALASRTKAEVRAIHSLDDYAADTALLRGEDPSLAASGALARALQPLVATGIRTTYDTYRGDPATRILEDAAIYKPSLIAMATHGRSGADRWFRGSVAERVLRRSPFPVFLVNPRSSTHGVAIKKILVPVDGSEMSSQILPIVTAFARAHSAEVLLLHVIEGTPALHPVDSLTRTPDEARALVGDLARRLEGVRTRTLVEKGSPSVVILDTARHEQVDLVAMTTHGRSGPSRWLFGSTAEHVLHQCGVPLLVQRNAGQAAPARAG